MTTAHGVRTKHNIGRGERERPIFLAICKEVGLPQPAWEWGFAHPRRYRFDYCWPESRVAIEIIGGLFVQGAHSRGAHQLSDMEKANLAAERGWMMLYTVPGKGDARMPGLLNLATARMVLRVIAARQEPPPVSGAQQRRLAL